MVRWEKITTEKQREEGKEWMKKGEISGSINERKQMKHKLKEYYNWRDVRGGEGRSREREGKSEEERRERRPNVMKWTVKTRI